VHKGELVASEKNERAWMKGLTYKRPYTDKWGALHDPTTPRDELLKYYKHWVVLLVSEATRKKAQSAEVGALKLIRAEERRRRENLRRAHRLEADYLEWADRRKHWKRRKRQRQNKKNAKAKAVAVAESESPANGRESDGRAQVQATR
jgi:hypothetical protein